MSQPFENGHYFIDAGNDEIKTLAFAFPQEERKVRGIWSFTTALLSSAMDSTVREARLQTEETGGVVCDLPVYLDTFDFPKAFETELEENRFLRVANDLKGRIRISLNQIFGVGRYRVLRTTKYSRDDVSEIFDDLYNRYPVTKLEANKLMIDRSVRRGKSAHHDERCYIDTFNPVNGKIEVCQVGLPFNLTAPLPQQQLDVNGHGVHPKMGNLFINVNDGAGKSVDSLAYLALSVKDGRAWNRILIFLKEDVKAYPITVVTRFDGDVFGDYRRRGWDFFSTFADLGMTCNLHRWICVLDDDCELVPQDIKHLDDEGLNELLPFAKSLSQRLDMWSIGTASAPRSVEDLLKSHCNESLEPNVTRNIVSWESKDLTPGVSAGFKFIRKLPGDD